MPFLQAELARAVRPQIVEPLRDHDLVAPGLAGDPAVHAQIVGGRGDDVGNGIDHVAPAVAVEIDRITLECRRHELRRTERARPRALEPIRPHVAAMNDFERRKEFLPEIILAPADAGERRGRLQHRALADRAAEIRFDPPDRRDDVAVDPIGFLHRREYRLVFRQNLPSAGDAGVVHQKIEIIPQRLRELRLGVEQVHDVEIGLEIPRVGLERLP